MKQVLSNRNLRRLALISLFTGFTEAMYSLRAVFLAENGLDASEIGIMFSITGILGTIAPLLGGVLADRFLTRYKVFLIALFGFATVIAFTPLSATVSIAGVLLSMLLLPMMHFFDPILAGMIQTCSINATNGLPGVDYSYLRVFMSSGYIISNVLCTPVIRRFGINAPFYFVLIFFVGIFTFRKSLKENETDRTQTEVIDKKKLHFSELFKNYYVISFVVLAILYAAAACCSNYTVYMIRYNSLDASDVTLVAGLKVIGEVVIMLSFPWFRKTFSLSGLQLLAGLFLFLDLILMLHARTLGQMILFEIVGGLGNGIAISSAGHYLRAMSPRGLEATAIAMWTAGTNLGAILLPLILGLVIDRSGIIACYTMGAVMEGAWVVLFIGTLLFGKYILKKDNICPIFLQKE